MKFVNVIAAFTMYVAVCVLGSAVGVYIALQMAMNGYFE